MPVICDTKTEAPRVLPAVWTCEGEAPFPPGALCYRRKCGLVVIFGVEEHAPGSRWLHVSFSRKYRLPSWDDLREVKDLFVGRDRIAVQILPRADQYVNAHPHVLHLWHRLDGPTLAATHQEEA